MIKLDDIVVLGMAVPEQIKDGRKTVCVAAYHQDLGLLRVYPCRADMGLNRWRRISAYLERNPQDNRYESWKLMGPKDQWDSFSITVAGKIPPEERADILERIKSPCVNAINTARFSLGIIKPFAINKCWIDRNPSFEKPIQQGLSLKDSDQWISTKADYPFQPRVAYQCSPECKGHDQTILEWGAFEWMRKNPGEELKLLDNWKLLDSGYDHYLLVGNQRDRRNSFMVINMLWFKREQEDNPDLRQSDLFSNPLPRNWEYIRQSVFVRDNSICHYCGIRINNPHCDHVIPRSKGGPDTVDNLVTACCSCNLRKGAKVLL